MAAGILSLKVQWLRLRAPNVGGPGLIPGQGTRSHLRRQRSCTAPKAWCCHTHTQKAGNLLSLLTLKSRSYFSAALYAGPGLCLFWPKEYSGSDTVPVSSLSLWEPSLHIVREPEFGYLPRSLWTRTEAPGGHPGWVLSWQLAVGGGWLESNPPPSQAVPADATWSKDDLSQP